MLGRSKYHRRYEPIWYGWHTKGQSPERIDGIVALIMATGRAALHDLPTWSVYDDPGYEAEFV